jgi:uncharacterized membrane protein
MEKINWKNEIVPWVFLLAPCIYCAYVWNQLPDSIPIHFNINGDADNWGPKGAILLSPGINIFTYLLLLFVPYLDPKKMSYEAFAKNFYKIRVLLTIFFSVISIVIIRATISNGSTITHIIPAIIFLLLALMGNYMINIKPNWFIGIRTPWTLSNETVWKQTHLVGGRLWFYGGLLCLLLSLFLPSRVTGNLLLCFVLGSALFMVAYSWWLFQKEGK